MFVRRLVSGVRSSWLASSTRARWAWRPWSIVASMRLTARARRAISSSPSAPIGPGTLRLAATPSTASVSSPTGRSPARATQRPSNQATRTPSRQAITRSRPKLCWVFWPVRSLTATCTAPPPSAGTVSIQYESSPMTMRSSPSCFDPEATARAADVTGRASVESLRIAPVLERICQRGPSS